MNDRVYEILLLGVTIALLTLLVPWNRSRAPLSWTAMGTSAFGIFLLVANAMRGALASAIPDTGLWLDPETGHFSIWRAAELSGVVLVGVGIMLLARTAEHERSDAQRRRQLGALAPAMDLPEQLLMALIQSTPGTVLLLTNRAGRGEPPLFHVVFAEGSPKAFERSHRGVGDNSCPLSEFYVASLAEHIQAVAARALSGGVFEDTCQGDASGRWFRFSAAAHGVSVIVVFEDITERRQVEESLRQVAFTDTVTGLANRASLETALHAAMQLREGAEPARFAVLYIDFDGFKRINDTLGHHVGDALLASIADRLSSSLANHPEPTDIPSVAARWGGDEFVVLLRESRMSEIDAFAERLVETLAEPHDLGGKLVTSTASIGVAVHSGQYESHKDIVRDADAAMYEAKRRGRNRVIRAEEVAARPPLAARRSGDWNPDAAGETDDGSRRAG